MPGKKYSSTNAAKLRLRSDSITEALEELTTRAGSLLGALGIFLVAGVIVAAFFTWVFTELAERVMSGGTEAFDEAILRWMSAHQSKALTSAMLEITTLGTGTVLIMIVCVAALFLTLTKHRYSALLLLVATGGGLLLDMVLKLQFNRPRPHVFIWGTH